MSVPVVWCIGFCTWFYFSRWGVFMIASLSGWAGGPWVRGGRDIPACIIHKMPENALGKWQNRIEQNWKRLGTQCVCVCECFGWFSYFSLLSAASFNTPMWPVPSHSGSRWIKQHIDSSLKPAGIYVLIIKYVKFLKISWLNGICSKIHILTSAMKENDEVFTVKAQVIGSFCIFYYSIYFLLTYCNFDLTHSHFHWLLTVRWSSYSCFLFIATTRYKQLQQIEIFASQHDMENKPFCF